MDLKEQLRALLHEVVKMNQTIVDKGAYKHLVSLCELDIRIIYMIAGHQKMSIKAIYSALSLPKTTVVSAIERLTKRGYVQKKVDASDRRQQCVELTELGKRANWEHEDYEDKILNFILEKWNKEDQEQLALLIYRRRKSDEL